LEVPPKATVRRTTPLLVKVICVLLREHEWRVREGLV
jgi:hypothetical protein